MYICIYIYIYIHMCQPLPCSPAGETAVLPLMLCSESCSSHRSSSPEDLILILIPIG